MPAKFGDDLGGIRTLEGLRVRCYANPDTHCWEYRGSAGKAAAGNGVEPRLWLADARTSTTISRAAWLLAGKRELRPGETVWRRCCVDTCCNPAHLMAGTKAKWGAWVSKRGHLRGRPERSAINRRVKIETGQTALTTELAQWIRESQQTGRQVAHAIGVSEQVISRVRTYATFKPPRPSSVFALAQCVADEMRRAA